MDEAEIIVNGQKTISIKKEFGMMNTANSSIHWDGEMSHIPKSQNDMWQNAPIKDEYMKDIQDVTMKEEPLEITDEEDWSEKISELPRAPRSPRLPQIEKDVVRVDCASILAKALLPPISQKSLPKRRKDSSAIPRRRTVSNCRKKGKPRRPAKLGRRTSSESGSAPTGGAEEEEDPIFVNGGNMDERLTDEERSDIVAGQVTSGRDQEFPTAVEPLNLKVKCGLEEQGPNGPPGNSLLPEERIKLALRKILTRGFRAGAMAPDNLGSAHSPPLPILNLEPVPQHPDVPIPKTPQLHSPCEMPSSPEVQSPPLGVGSLSVAPLSPFEKTPLKTGYITDHDLLTMNVRELNQRFRDMPKTLRLKYKQRRRTLKNRQYAQNCRQKRASHRHEIESLNAILKAEVHRHQAEITRLVAQTGELRRSNERLKKNMDLLQKENLALKKDWMRSEERPWLWEPGEKLGESPQGVETPMVTVNLAEAPSIKSEPEQTLQSETGEGVDAGELPQAAVEVKLGALEESEEEVDLEDGNAKQKLKEDEERTQLLKERLDYECKSKKQQILLQQQQSLLQQQVRILQLLQLQQQRQLQMIQEPELQDLSFLSPESVQSLKPDEEKELHPPESLPSPEQPRSPQSQLPRKSPKAKQAQLHKKSPLTKHTHKSQEPPLSIQPPQLSQSQLPRKCSKVQQAQLPEKFQLSKQPHKSQEPRSSIQPSQLSQPAPQSVALQNPLLSQALHHESSASLLDPSLAMQLQSTAALLQTPNVVSGSLGSFYLVG